MDSLQLWLDRAGALVWGGSTVVLFLATAAYLSFVLRGVQLRRLVAGLRTAFLTPNEPSAEGDLSHFQALMLALGGSVGLGNLLGVAGALAAGGPGALFWLWIAGWLVMATRYAEGVLGIYYREPDRRGRMGGGPMYYLSQGVGGWFGRFLAAAFAVLALVAAVGTGAAAPGHAAAAALSSFSVPPLATGLVLAAAAGAVVAGGVRAIGRTLGVLVPVLVAAYLVAAVAVLVINVRLLDDVLVDVVRDAFTAEAAAGGVLGASLREAVRWGMTQGTFSAGSGFGIGAIAASTARTRRAVAQAEVAMMQTFIDTVVVSAVTGLAILVAGAGAMDAADAYIGVPATTAVVRSGLPAGFGGAIVALGLAAFALSTVLAWAHYGERSAEYLLGARATTPFRVLLVVAVFAGAAAVPLGGDGFGLILGLGHVAGGAMVIPSLVGLLLLSGVVVRETERAAGRPPGGRED